MIIDNGKYEAFIERKSQLGGLFGFKPVWKPEFLFDFQRVLTGWAIRKGRAAIFADCGLGKTPMQLVWADNVVRKTNRPVLVLTPLSVAQQTIEEAEKFSIDAEQSRNGKYGKRIVVTNYERLHYFDSNDFAGVVCDESSIIKNFAGVRKAEITQFMRKVEYRLLCSATAAPNDYIEFGTSSEALGELGYMDMLAMFFKNEEDSLHPAFVGSQWRFKRHAEKSFWRWVASWARACRKPSDLGFSDDRFELPDLVVEEHKVPSPVVTGFFAMPAKTLAEQREERKRTIKPRCEVAAECLMSNESGVAWCHLNAEGDLLTRLIQGAEQVSGSDKDEKKEELFKAFRSGQVRVLVTKPRIAGFGLNWQHCNKMTYFPSHSFEQYYQAMRRLWRFGQEKPVKVDVVTSEAERGVLENLSRKAEACSKMFDVLVAEMNNALSVDRSQVFERQEETPKWL